MKLSLFSLLSVSVAYTLSVESASTGRVAIREVEKAYTDGLSHMVDSYEARNKTIDFKTVAEWNSMNKQDFEQYDALVMVAFECHSENPFSNSIMWSSAVHNGNSIIMGASDININDSSDIKEVVDSAVEFTLSGKGTGSYISIGQMTASCLEVNATAWMTEAFNNDFGIRSILPSDYWKNRLVARHFAFDSVNEAMVKTAPDTANILPIFTKYPEQWYPLVVNTKSLGSLASFVSEDGSIIGAPTILIKGTGILMPGESMPPSCAPSEVPSFLTTESQNNRITSSPSNGRKSKKSSLKYEDKYHSGLNKVSKKNKKGSKSGKNRSKST
jgi:hypothetical protein